jgi:acyl-CoA thioesterase FadM
MDRALADWFAEAGHGLASLAEGDLAPVGVHSECDHPVKVSTAEVLDVRAGVTAAHRTSFSVTYVFLRGDAVAGAARTVHACRDRAGDAVPVPRWVRDRLTTGAALLGAQGIRSPRGRRGLNDVADAWAVRR